MSQKDSIDIEELKELYDEGFTQMEIAAYYSISPSTIQSIISENDIKSGYNRLTTCELDEDYFKSIDTKEKAYWLGYITGDGCINKYSMHLNVSARDASHLIQFRDDINSSHNISYYAKTNSVQFAVTRKSFVEHLKANGVKQNKSTKDINMLYMEEDFIPHFIRGLFDADGCISYYKHDNGNKYYNFRITNTRRIIYAVNAIISSVIGNRNKVYDGNSDTYILSYGNKDDMKAIYEYLYSDATRYLNRKKDIFDDFIGLKFSEDVIIEIEG